MADLGSLTTFPGQLDNNISTTEFCRVEVVTVDLEGEDAGTTIEDIHSTSIFERYRTPPVEDEKEEDYQGGTPCVALTFYTEGGEVCRYIDDSQADDVYQVFARVLAALGQKGWQAINVMTDEQFDETWYLQRMTRG
jgi:hypothetical protein